MLEILQRRYTFNTKFLREMTSILVSSVASFKRSRQGFLIFVYPKAFLEYKRVALMLNLFYHSTGCPLFSRAILTVAHENLTTEGNPKVGSREFCSHAWVLGSKFKTWYLATRIFERGIYRKGIRSLIHLPIYNSASYYSLQTSTLQSKRRGSL